MTTLARRITRHRRLVIVVWVALTMFGVFSASQVSKRWFESFSIPGFSAYEANQRTLKTFGSGENAPLIVVVHTNGDATKTPGVKQAINAAAGVTAGSRVSSFFNTGSDTYVSRDRHTTFAEIFRPGTPGFGSDSGEAETRATLRAAAPAGTTVYLTGRDPLQTAASKGNTGPSILGETLLGGLGALIILLFVFGTLPAVAMPLLTAMASILNTFSLVWLLTYFTNVSIIVQFLIALVGLGVSIDYALLIIFRFREELRHGASTNDAIETTMEHAGRSVIVSGSTVAVGLLSMVLLPLPFIRSIGIGGMLIPAVSVLASITLLPAMLSMLGPGINRLRVMPRRIVEGSDDASSGFWSWWANVVTRHAALTAAAGLAIVAALLYAGVQLNPSESQAKDMPGGGDAIAGRQALAAAGISAGAFKPFEILVEGSPSSAQLTTIARRVARAPGVAGAVAPIAWRTGSDAIIEAIPTADGATAATKRTISQLEHGLLPAIEADSGLHVTLGGIAAEDQDFVHAVYGNFGYVLLFVVLLTYILLARAFRSLILPLKAVILNLVSLGAAYGIIVIIFQWGHGAEAIWNVPSTNSIIPWIPLMIFAFLYGLSMDYEVFMLTRMREAYDESGDTRQAIVLGLSRTGKLITSAALVLCLAFFVLSTSPGTDIKQFGIGLSAGILFDATVIRALLVPSIMMLLGRWNWVFPAPVARVLLVRPPEPAPVD